MELWYPQAKQDKFTDAGSFVAGPYRGLLHTTEGSTYAGARSAYAASGNMPHFTIGAEGCWQHCQLDHASRALVNAPGGVETNRLSCIQIEVIGFATNPDWPDSLFDAVRALMVWVEQQTGIQPHSPTFEAYPASYGYLNGVRMLPTEWAAFNGWCGHQHAPENDHGDPGAIHIDRLLARGGSQPTPGPAPAPTTDWTEEMVMALPTLQRGSQGQWVRNLQALLIVAANDLQHEKDIDGDFGPHTETVLRTWQARTNKLTPDGICGPATWRWLIGA